MLIVDDDESIRAMLAEFLEFEGYKVGTAQDGRDALDKLRHAPYHVVLTDLKMPRMGGIALLEAMAREAPRTPTVIMTGFGTVETAIDAMKRGAYDYLLKPFKLDAVLHVIERAMEKRRIEAENIRLREALSLYKVSEAISASLSLNEVLETVASGCLNELGADWYSAWLDDGEGRWIERQHKRRDEDAAAELGRVNPRSVMRRLRSEPSVLVHGAEVQDYFQGPADAVASLLAVPLRAQSGAIGFVALGSEAPGRLWQEGQRKLLSIVASRAAAAIENAQLYVDLRDTFQQTIEGLAKAIDKMDRYTAGHSERVAGYAVGIARRLGLASKEVETVRQTALLHDIGKIGCMLNLNKTEELTDEEYRDFKQHPVHGREILRPIKFLHPLISGVYLHHERHDGRGYPLGLSGDEIPRLAQIISIADAYDAMTSDRSYRHAMPWELARAEIERCAGSQFEPELARTFLGYLDEEPAADGEPDEQRPEPDE